MIGKEGRTSRVEEERRMYQNKRRERKIEDEGMRRDKRIEDEGREVRNAQEEINDKT
jgi:hypothetical protein